MLVLTPRLDQTLSFVLPNGLAAHFKVVKIANGSLRMVFFLPDEIRVTRDTMAAHNVFKDFTP